MSNDIRVWNFGARAPTAGADLVQEQLRKARAYYNQLIELGNQQRTEFRALRRQHAPELAALEEQIEAIEERAEAAGAYSDEVKVQLRDLRKALRDRRAEYKQLLAPANQELSRRLEGFHTHRRKEERERQVRLMCEEDWPQAWKETIRLGELDRSRKLAARQASGLHSGTYAAIEASVQQAFDTSRQDPGFKRFDGSGKIGVQIQGGYALADEGPCSMQHGQLEIAELPEGQWETRSGRRHAYARVRVRVGRDSEGQPRWAEFPVLFHRRPRGRVQWAYIVVRKVGNRLRYELQLTLKSEAFDRTAPADAVGTCAINFGWRGLRNGHLRVARLVDSEGQCRELTLSPELRERLAFPEQLRSHADLHFDAARAELASWMRRHPELVSAELRQQTKSMVQWRKHARLAKLAFGLTEQADPGRALVDRLWQSWKLSRLASDQDLFAEASVVYAWAEQQGVSEPFVQLAVYLEWWRRKNRHLYQWECDTRRRALNARRDLYRKWARQVADGYQHIKIEKFDLRDVALRPPKGSEQTRQEKLARHNRVLAAPSELRLALRSAAGRVAGGGAPVSQIQEQKAHNNTRRCRFCGQVSEVDAKAKLCLVCPVCHNEPLGGRGDDQDTRNCINQLTRHEWSGDDDSPGTSRSSSEHAGAGA
jgi:hypothetical protein